MSEVVLCGRADTAGRTARRCAVTWTACRRRRAALSTGARTDRWWSLHDPGRTPVLGDSIDFRSSPVRPAHLAIARKAVRSGVCVVSVSESQVAAYAVAASDKH